ncbi:hypothetical protein ILYODFUR_038853 [Ilyodon furcidens]|uniref:Uncharacterized protein n=1 Tax=Ilyodon furcidens TaxID=33524 RepID=A0ABV0UP31_9TELE
MKATSKSIHPSIVFRLSRVGLQGQQPKQREPDFPPPQPFRPGYPRESQGGPRPAEKHSPSSVSWAILCVRFKQPTIPYKITKRRGDKQLVLLLVRGERSEMCSVTSLPTILNNI